MCPRRYISPIGWFLCSHSSICLQVDRMCPFPEVLLKAINSVEEFSPLPIASSTTGGPIILLPYRDRWGGGLQEVFKGYSLPSYTAAFFFFLSPLTAYLYQSFLVKGKKESLCANLSLRETQSYIFELPDYSTLNHWNTEQKTCFLTTLCALLKSNSGLITRCTAHTPASSKRPLQL